MMKRALMAALCFSFVTLGSQAIDIKYQVRILQYRRMHIRIIVSLVMKSKRLKIL